jgi:predicted Zn finger-like uncharacterized protein
MKITCSSCSAKYTIADEKVRGRTVKIKCKKCGATITAGPDTEGAVGASAETNLAGQTSGEWLANVGEGDQRSLTAEQVVELYQQGVISDDTYLWRDGMAEWLPLASVSELSSLLPARAPAAPPDEMDDGMPTMMAPAFGFNPAAPAAAAPLPAAGAPAPAAARRSAPRGRDLFAAPDDAVAAGFAAPTTPTGPPPPRRPEPPAAGMMNSDEASGILDIRKLQGALDSKDSAPKKDEKVDDIMNLGGGALFSSPMAPPDFNALAPPDFSAPPPPEPEPPRPVAAVAAAPMAAPIPAEPPKKPKTALLALGGVAILVLGIGGTVLVMNGKKGGEEDGKTTTVASADPEKKGDGAAKVDEKKDEPKVDSAHNDDKKDDKKPAEVEAEPPPGKELTPEEKKRRDEAFKKKKEEDKKKKEEEEAKKKAKEEEEAKKKKAEAENTAAAAAPGGDKPFDRAAANSALSSIAASAASCKKPDGPTGSGKVAVTFAPSGNVTTTNIEGSFAGTSVGSCVAGRFRGAKVPPFSGSPVTVKKTFTIN